MKTYGSTTELTSVVFKEDSNDVTLRPNQATTYSASRDIQLPPGDAAHVLVSANSTSTLTNKTIDGDDNTISDLALTSLKTVLGDADKVLVRNASGVVISSNAVPNTSAMVTTDASQSLSNKTLASPVITTAATINAAGELRFADSDSTNYVGFKSPGTVGTNKIWTLPSVDGSANQFLQTDGSATLQWASALTNPFTTTGDLLYSSTTASPGTPARLAIGTNNAMLFASSGLPAWSSITTLGWTGATMNIGNPTGSVADRLKIKGTGVSTSSISVEDSASTQVLALLGANSSNGRFRLFTAGGVTAIDLDATAANFSTFTNGVRFGGSSPTQTTLNNNASDSGSLVFASGFSVSESFSFKVRRISDTVSLEIAFNGTRTIDGSARASVTSNANIPAGFRPAQTLYFPITTRVSGVERSGAIAVNSSGTVVLYFNSDLATVAAANATSTGALACCVTYIAA